MAEMSQFSLSPPTLGETSGEHERMSDVGEPEMTAECRIVGHKRRRGLIVRTPGVVRVVRTRTHV